MNENLITLYNDYVEKYDDFPIVLYNLNEEQQEALIEVIELALTENRQITKTEIDKFQPDDDGIDF